MKRRRPLRALRRRMRRQTTRVRSVLLRRFFLPRRKGRAAVLRYAAVLDGQTVNLHARMPHWVRPEEGARIELRRRGRRLATAAKVYTDHDGGVAMDAAILLGQDVNGLPLTPGRWKIRLRLSRGCAAARCPCSSSTFPCRTAARRGPWRHLRRPGPVTGWAAVSPGAPG